MKKFKGKCPGMRIRVRKGWDREGEKAIILGPPVFKDQWWVPVLFEGEDDPDLHKAAAFEEFDEVVNPNGGGPDCRHFIGDAACKVSANLIPEEDCEHCPIPKLERKAKEARAMARCIKRELKRMGKRSDMEVMAEMKQQDEKAKKEGKFQ
jgi:hypothetical protein